MAIDVFVPTKLNSEKDRFKAEKGNIKIDYRDTTNIIEPYLLSTPYIRWDRGVVLDVASRVVITDPPVSGDNTDYRRFGTDIMFKANDYQTNTLFLLSDYIIFEVSYEKTEFIKSEFEMFLRHIYSVNETNLSTYQENTFLEVDPLYLDTSETTAGFVDKVPTVIFKKNRTLFTGYASLSTAKDDLGESVYTIYYDEDTLVDYGVSGSLIDVGLVSEDIKNLETFSANSSTSDFKSKLHFISSFTNTGSKLITENPSVLTVDNPNYTLYSKTIATDPDIVGFTFNLHPSNGALFHVIVESSLQDLTQADIGQSVLYFHPIYTGKLASEFGLFNVELPTISENITITINGIETLLGSFKKSENTKFIEALQSVLSPLNVTVLECEDDFFILDNTSSIDYEVRLLSKSTEFILHPQFISFKFPNSSSSVPYDLQYHKSNYSCSHIPETLEDTPSLLEYKFSLTKNTRSSTEYIDNTFLLSIKADQVVDTTVSLPLRLNDVESIVTVVIAPEDQTVDAILSKFVIAFTDCLGESVGVVANNLTSSITFSNLSTTEIQTVSLGKAVWYSIDSKKGVLQNTSDDLFKIRLMHVSGG